MDFDEDRIYYSHQNLQQQERPSTNGVVDTAVDGDEDDNVDLGAARRHFREFLRNYRQGPRYLYRDRLLRMHQRTSGDDYTPHFASTNPNGTSIEVDLAHVQEYDATLLGLLLNQPATVLPPFEMAAADALKTLLFDLKTSRGNSGDLEDGDDFNDATTTQETEEGGSQDVAPTAPTSLDDEYTFNGNQIQILLRGNMSPTPLRCIQSNHLNMLIRCPGIVISASRVRSRALGITVRCGRCNDVRKIPSTSGPFGGVLLPNRCAGPDPGQCGNTPYSVVPDECTFIDQQTLKLQEAPESVPTGEMPRSVLMAVERSIVDKAAPGTRVNVLAIASLFNSNSGGSNGSVKTVYLRVVGLQRESSSGDNATFTPREEESFRLLARRSDIHNILSRSIAPSISGSYTVDIKKAIACMLFSGSRKRLPDGMKLRGDINVLLLGDPSTAKSQFLKFTTRVAPIGVYTSGKGSSAAGLTASVVKDAKGEFYLEGGAMVLADGGIVAIDEFDKMRPADRVAIHEAMEQQTISIAKAGITTVLNSRASVLAAANPVYGRYDDLKSASENIDLMATILSRFDLIFLVRDVRDEERDRMICKHVMGVHINSSRNGGSEFGPSGGAEGSSGAGSNDRSSSMAISGGGMNELNGAGGNAPDSAEAIAENAMRIATTGVGELDVPTMKKYIQYCKAKCSPRLSEEAGDVLASSYVKIRDDVRKRSLEGQSGGGDTQAAIPITVRQLEALVRLSESLAKMRLEPEVQSEDVAEALRLFKVSTMAANAAETGVTPDGASGTPSAGVGNAVMPSREEMMRTESFLRSRLAIGAIVNKQRIIEEAAGQGYNALLVSKAMAVMVMRSEIQERNQSRLIKRIK